MSQDERTIYGRVAQFGRAPRSQRGGRRFDPDHVQTLRPRSSGVFSKRKILWQAKFV